MHQFSKLLNIISIILQFVIFAFVIFGLVLQKDKKKSVQNMFNTFGIKKVA